MEVSFYYKQYTADLFNKIKTGLHAMQQKYEIKRHSCKK